MSKIVIVGCSFLGVCQALTCDQCVQKAKDRFSCTDCKGNSACNDQSRTCRSCNKTPGSLSYGMCNKNSWKNQWDTVAQEEALKVCESTPSNLGGCGFDVSTSNFGLPWSFIHVDSNDVDSDDVTAAHRVGAYNFAW